MSATRRLARQKGVRLIIGPDERRGTVVLEEQDLVRSLQEVAARAASEAGDDSGPVYLKVGRRVARLLNWADNAAR